MHSRRIASFLLGAWMVWSLGMCLVAFRAFSTVDVIMDNPGKTAEEVVAQLGADRARGLIQYFVAAESGRLLLTSELVQVGFGIVLAGAFLADRSTRLLSIAAVVMLLLAGFQHIFLTPELLSLGQGLAFTPEGGSLAERGRLANVRTIYGVTEGLKILLGLAATLILFALKSGRRHRSHRSESRNSEILEGRVTS